MTKKEYIPLMLWVAAFISYMAIACTMQQPQEEIPDSAYTIRTIDGCEYIEVERGVGDTRTYSLTHKGNCRNPIHYFKDNNQYKYVLDLPPNYNLISADAGHKDTLTGYVSRDTLYINFLRK